MIVTGDFKNATADYNWIRNSAVADKPHEAFAQYAIAWPTPKTLPFPYVF